MKKLILIIIALSFVSVCFAASVQDMHSAVIASKNADAGVSYDIEETFEGSEYDNNTCGTAPCVTESDGTAGEVDGNHSTSGLDMPVGSTYCLRLDTARALSLEHTPVTAGNYVYYQFKHRYEVALGALENIALIYNTSESIISTLKIRNTNEKLFIISTGAAASSDSDLVINADQSAWIKIRYKVGSGGSNAQSCFSTYNAEWEAWNCDDGTGDNVTNVDRFYLQNTQDNNGVDYNYFDNIQVFVGADDPFTGAPE